MEFYEIKPNSAEGREAARAKVETFLSLVDFLAVDRPGFEKYRKGTLFDPDRAITFYQRNYLGIVPCKASLHYRRATESEIAQGVIVYEICVEVDGELLEAFAKAIIVSAIIAALAALAAAAAVVFGGGVLGPAVLAFDSPWAGRSDRTGQRPPGRQVRPGARQRLAGRHRWLADRHRRFVRGGNGGCALGLPERRRT
ncbi:hypothetical protein ACFQ1B_06070 [Streptomyces mexicanus]